MKNTSYYLKCPSCSSFHVSKHCTLYINVCSYASTSPFSSQCVRSNASKAWQRNLRCLNREGRFLVCVGEGQFSEAQTESQSAMNFRILIKDAGFISYTITIFIKFWSISPWF